MTAISLLAELSLMELVIFGFIGANMTLASACLVQHGLKRSSNARLER